ncbi:hypothetical protein AB32_4905 [Escherichia coli 2-316-03_S1_C2]|nr:hypothetical protein ECSTECC16502_0034 [Escherichia coli STEC_C165-02]KDY09407.1 hypothetical protein AC72_3546 [Escherichia coli 2-316-03_S4_C1]KEJ20745.1 hypothetical protein AB03_4948 [Escherichia coli 2-316-03_S1_C1]KEJ21513.1 hypothetical protein AB32_4905 [Escherichia coli 2-316-03_S1_C2]
MFCSTWIKWHLPSTSYLAKHTVQKITHSGDSQPPAMREKSTMFLWNK